MKILAVLTLALALIAAPGCEMTPQQTSELLTEYRLVLTEADARIADARATLASLDESSVAHAQATRVIETAEQARDRAAAVLVSLESSVGPDGSITPEGGLTAIGTILPPPFNIIVPLVGGLGLGLWRSAKNRQAARELAESVRALPIFEEALKDPENVRILNAGQGKTAKRIVDEVQHKVAAIPI